MTVSTKIAHQQLVRVVAAVAPETLRVPVHTVERGCEAIDLRATIVWP
jgi:hypothetical protein